MEVPTLVDAAHTVTTADRILAAGMRCFARKGFTGATTRMIASEAGVTLPVIAYHFGNKDGLHRACAREIVEHHRRHLLPLTSAAREAISGSLAPANAREWLEKILTALVTMITADPDQRQTTDFVLRELTEQGPGYVLLYEELWQPGIGLFADLIAIARNRAPGSEEDRAGALMLIASLSAFTRDEPISRAFLGWDALDETRRDKIAEIFCRLLGGLVAQ